MASPETTLTDNKAASLVNHEGENEFGIDSLWWQPGELTTWQRQVMDSLLFSDIAPKDIAEEYGRSIDDVVVAIKEALAIRFKGRESKNTTPQEDTAPEPDSTHGLNPYTADVSPVPNTRLDQPLAKPREIEPRRGVVHIVPLARPTPPAQATSTSVTQVAQTPRPQTDVVKADIKDRKPNGTVKTVPKTTNKDSKSNEPRVTPEMIRDAKYRLLDGVTPAMVAAFLKSHKEALGKHDPLDPAVANRLFDTMEKRLGEDTGPEGKIEELRANGLRAISHLLDIPMAQLEMVARQLPSEVQDLLRYSQSLKSSNILGNLVSLCERERLASYK